MKKRSAHTWAALTKASSARAWGGAMVPIDRTLSNDRPASMETQAQTSVFLIPGLPAPYIGGAAHTRQIDRKRRPAGHSTRNIHTAGSSASGSGHRLRTEGKTACVLLQVFRLALRCVPRPTGVAPTRAAHAASPFLADWIRAVGPLGRWVGWDLAVSMRLFSGPARPPPKPTQSAWATPGAATRSVMEAAQPRLRRVLGVGGL